jgi:hypothetical protein
MQGVPCGAPEEATMSVILLGDKTAAARWLAYAKSRAAALAKQGNNLSQTFSPAEGVTIRVQTLQGTPRVWIEAGGMEYFVIAHDQPNTKQQLFGAAKPQQPFRPVVSPSYDQSIWWVRANQDDRQLHVGPRGTAFFFTNNVSSGFPQMRQLWKLTNIGQPTIKMVREFPSDTASGSNAFMRTELIYTGENLIPDPAYVGTGDPPLVLRHRYMILSTLDMVGDSPPGTDNIWVHAYALQTSIDSGATWTVGSFGIDTNTIFPDTGDKVYRLYQFPVSRPNHIRQPVSYVGNDTLLLTLNFWDGVNLAFNYIQYSYNLISTNNGASWELIGGAINSIEPDPVNGGDYIVSSYPSAHTFVPIGKSGASMVVLAQADSAIAGDIQTWVSYDRGANFNTLVTVSVAGLSQHRAPICTATGCAIFAALVSGFGWKFYRTLDYGSSWTQVGEITDGFVERYTLFIAGQDADGLPDGTKAFIGCSVDIGEGNKVMYLSSDGGATWARGGKIAGTGFQLPQRVLHVHPTATPNPAIPDLYTL